MCYYPIQVRCLGSCHIVLVCTLVGSVSPIELIIEKDWRFESMSELFPMNMRVTTGMQFRCKITIGVLQPNQGCWVLTFCPVMSVAAKHYKKDLGACVPKVSDSYHSVQKDLLLRWFSLVVWVVVWLAGQTRQCLVPEYFAMLFAMPEKVSGLVGSSYLF